jgi:glutaryl-CoA dehydrogenase
VENTVNSLNALDLLNVQSLLSDEERMVQDTVQRFVNNSILPIIRECFEEHRFPQEVIPEIASLGLLGNTLEGYDCAGLSNVCAGLIYQELERGDSAIRSFVSVQSSLVMYPVFTFGSDAQKTRWLAAMARGEAIGCFGLTESHGGSDPSNMKTHAKRDGDDWILNGAKMWITNGAFADVAVIWAMTPDGIRGFLVERDTPGFSATEIENKFSLRASSTAALFLDNVRVPDENVLPGATGLGPALKCLSQARLGIAWGPVGSAQACLQEALDFTATRKLFGRALSHTQSIQLRLADMARRISTAQLLALHLSRLKDRDDLQPTQISIGKWNNVRMARDVARDCRENMESIVTYEGTETVHQLVVGKELTGISAF